MKNLSRPPILPFVRDAEPGVARLVVPAADAADLFAVLDKCADYRLIKRGRPGPAEPVMHFVRCPSLVAAERLERSWHQHRLMKYAHGR